MRVTHRQRPGWGAKAVVGGNKAVARKTSCTQRRRAETASGKTVAHRARDDSHVGLGGDLLRLCRQIRSVLVVVVAESAGDGQVPAHASHLNVAASGLDTIRLHLVAGLVVDTTKCNAATADHDGAGITAVPDDDVIWRNECGDGRCPGPVLARVEPFVFAHEDVKLQQRRPESHRQLLWVLRIGVPVGGEIRRRPAQSAARTSRGGRRPPRTVDLVTSASCCRSTGINSTALNRCIGDAEDTRGEGGRVRSE